MSIVKTTLAGAKAANDPFITVASATGSLLKNVIQIENEFFVQTNDSSSNTTLNVLCGQQGTAQVAHPSGATVFMGLASEFPLAPQGTVVPIPYAPSWTVQTVVANGAITIPTSKQNTYVQLRGSTTNAYTLADPSYAQEGQELVIQAEAAHAYTVSNAAGSGFNGGGSGTDVATYGGAIGDNLHVKAVSGTWNVIDSVNITLG